MKKITGLMLIVSILFILASCGGGEKHGNYYLVKKIVTDNNGTVQTTTFDYDSCFKLKKSSISNNKNEYSSVEEFTYDESGYLIYQKKTSTTGIVIEIFSTNDEKGRVLLQRTATTYDGKTSEITDSYEYTDDYGSYTKTTSPTSSGNTTTMIYDEKGNVLKTFMGSLSVTYENKYAGERLIEAKATVKSGGNINVVNAKYDYDEYGNMVKETTYNEQGEIVVIQEFIYSSSEELINN